jgi:TPR repeat protein
MIIAILGGPIVDSVCTAPCFAAARGRRSLPAERLAAEEHTSLASGLISVKEHFGCRKCKMLASMLLAVGLELLDEAPITETTMSNRPSMSRRGRLLSAARRGDVRAQFECYRDGDGVRRNLRWARHWFEKAAALGVREPAAAFGALAPPGIGSE